MAGLAQVEYINFSYSNNHRFSDDSHLLITTCSHLKYSWCHNVPLFVTFHRGYSGKKGGEPPLKRFSVLNVYFIPKDCHEWPQLEQGMRAGISHGQSSPTTHTTSHNTGLICSFPQHCDAFSSLQPSSLNLLLLLHMWLPFLVFAVLYWHFQPGIWILSIFMVHSKFPSFPG